MAKKHIGIRASDELYNRLTAFCEGTGRTKTDVVRSAVAAVVMPPAVKPVKQASPNPVGDTEAIHQNEYPSGRYLSGVGHGEDGEGDGVAYGVDELPVKPAYIIGGLLLVVGLGYCLVRYRKDNF